MAQPPRTSVVPKLEAKDCNLPPWFTAVFRVHFLILLYRRWPCFLNHSRTVPSTMTPYRVAPLIWITRQSHNFFYIFPRLDHFFRLHFFLESPVFRFVIFASREVNCREVSWFCHFTTTWTVPSLAVIISRPVPSILTPVYIILVVTVAGWEASPEYHDQAHVIYFIRARVWTTYFWGWPFHLE